MSELRVDSVKSKGGGAPDLPKGVTISGIATAATLGATTVDVSNVNVSGVVTSGTLSGDLLSTGTPTLGLGVTINSSGVAISGVATAGIVSATTLYGDGTNLTGIGASIAPLFYNPDTSDGGLEITATGIGITFNQQIKAGTGNITLRLVGAAGTVVENFGVGSSVTISENRVSFTPTADLAVNTVYHLSYPSGAFTNNAGDVSYVGTAYTFNTRDLYLQLWGTGRNHYGQLGQNNTVSYSSPIQIPGSNWATYSLCYATLATKTDGALWSWGWNHYGNLGQNDRTQRSSPVQVGTDTTWPTERFKMDVGYDSSTPIAIKTDGTLWTWGSGTYGKLGQNNLAWYSSPVQIPGTTWSKCSMGQFGAMASKTDGTLWAWGNDSFAALGLNAEGTQRSSPTQIPGTTWTGNISRSKYQAAAIKGDGTLWTWGRNQNGMLGVNQSNINYSSPTQVPGTTWSDVGMEGDSGVTVAVKTDGTLWSWGYNNYGQLGHNNRTEYSSPVQVGSGTDWSDISMKLKGWVARKTDGTTFGNGVDSFGMYGKAATPGYSAAYFSSPVQIAGTWNVALGKTKMFDLMFRKNA